MEERIGRRKKKKRKRRGIIQKELEDGGTRRGSEDRVVSGTASVVAVENEILRPAGLRYASSNRARNHGTIESDIILVIVILVLIVIEAENGNGGIEVFWGCRWPTAGGRDRDDRAPGLRDPTRPLRARDRRPSAQSGRPLSRSKRLFGERVPIRPRPGRLPGDSLRLRDPRERGPPGNRSTARRARLGPLDRVEQTCRELLA